MKVNFNKIILFLIISLSIFGYYVILLLLFNAGLGSQTRLITIPLRLILIFLFLFLFLFNYKNLKFNNALKVFSFFSLIYLSRLFLDYINMESYYLSMSEVFFYFISFAVIPFVVLSIQRFSFNFTTTIFRAIFVSGVIFTLLSVLFYAKFIGSVSRLTSTTSGEDVISPLALSYSSSLIIGCFYFYLINNKHRLFEKFIGYLVICLAFIPFFLGSSRGSLIAVFLPFLIYYIYGKSSFEKLKGSIFIILIILVMIIFNDYFESGLINRFIGTSEAIQSGDSSAIRTQIWKSSYNQFLDNPFFGDKLRMNFSSGYPHNIFIEVLQTTGLLGFIPLLILMLYAWKLVFKILKYHKEHFWLAVIFIQAFVMSMFSGAIYTSSRLWLGTGILIAVNFYHKPKNNISNVRISNYNP